MKYFRQYQWLFGFALILVNPAVSAEETPPPFHYSDDWTLVSAPPPAGPYRLVNIDPRIPGPGAVEPMPVIPPPPKNPPVTGGEAPVPSGAQAEEQAAPALTGQATQETESAPSSMPPIPGMAPAAGIPAAPAVEEVPPEEAAPIAEEPAVSGYPGSVGSGWGQPAPPAPPPAAYARPVPQARPGYSTPPPSWYAYPPVYPRNPAGPPPGYYRQGGNVEPQVPPPPVYEGAYGRRPYNGGW